MEKNYKILSFIEKNNSSTQREIAKGVGLSLGMVNYVLKELAKKGIIKMENFRKSKNRWSYKYILTPKGIEEKTKITYGFLKQKMTEYNRIKKQIKELKKEVVLKHKSYEKDMDK
ncbi:MAG: MarR family EPS-associated transcriptional regulator [Deltaproteobacteria bacterium]|nr:MarR family EPS-associated transcriptional regulator [Deltaproteobacteria bacterium]